MFVVWGFSIFELLIFCALSSFVNVKLVSNFHYSHLNFKVNIFNEFNDYWHYIIDIFFFLIMLKFLKPNCHKKKKKRMVQVRNLFLQFEVALIFRAMPIYLYFLAYQKTRPHKKTWWKEPKQSTHWDLIKRSCFDTTIWK